MTKGSPKSSSNPTTDLNSVGFSDSENSVLFADVFKSTSSYYGTLCEQCRIRRMLEKMGMEVGPHFAVHSAEGYGE